jgi:hypothetical protein
MNLERHPELISTTKMLKHFARNLCWGIIFIVLALGIGMWGYHGFENMSWTDAFLNASMILSGMGPVTELQTVGGKIFAGSYALFSGLAFIAVMAVVFAPVIHRFFKEIHLESGSQGEL